MTILSAIVALLCAVSPPKTIVHTELLDSQHALLVYADCSMAVAPLATLAPDGTFLGGTTIEIIATSDKLTSRWVDAKGVTREVVTDCVTLRPVDCVVQHQKIVTLMEGAFPPVPKKGE